MAIIVKSKNPSELLKVIKKAIDEEEIDTWEYDKDGDFIHTPNQWRNKAWLRPKLYTDLKELRFGIISPENTKLERVIYGVYHGRFIEMLLTHFFNYFSSVYSTSEKFEPDIFDE